MLEGIDPVFISTLADLFVNLSAGWLAAAVVVSPKLRRPGKFVFLVLTGNVMAAILSLLLAFGLRKLL